MALRTRADHFNRYQTRIRTERIYPVSRMVSTMTGLNVQRNKAIVGENAFAHEAGIHQDGMLKERSTYEIMDPAALGIPSGDSIVLGRGEECDLILAERSISRRHATLEAQPDGISVRDLGSSNGTEVNGRMLEPSRRLELCHGDTLRICSSVLIFANPAAEKEETLIAVDFDRAKKEASDAVTAILHLVKKKG